MSREFLEKRDDVGDSVRVSGVYGFGQNCVDGGGADLFHAGGGLGDRLDEQAAAIAGIGFGDDRTGLAKPGHGR